jgi:hypothetical protein
MIVIIIFLLFSKMASVRIKGCKIDDIKKIVDYIKISKCQKYSSIKRKIEKESFRKSYNIIDTYDINNCISVITTYSNSSIYEAIKKSNSILDLSSELNFYKELAFPYLYDIIYYKIHTLYYNYYVPKKINKNETIECTICLDIIDIKDIHLTKCNHTFHNLCYYKYIKHKNNTSCPNCRQFLFC